ncbi:BTAD domain-containing putative transcriptional regulator, partial [Deinococcus pimensis]|uniref:BTAD domain-containing putative transcriptional regulator n=1 Tax=Deinococcus pimensis TaxID=309888 RepID=UPI0009FE1363
MATWQLRLLGPPALTGPDGRDVRLDRKSLGLLAYLALSGPTERARLAGLLWPDTPPQAARNNLVHLLRRQAALTGTPLVIGAGTLALVEGLAVDVRPLLDAPGGEGAGDVPLGTFVQGEEFDDLPDLADWTLAWREQIAERQVESLRAARDLAERRGDLTRALAAAQQVVTHDRLSEEAHRHVMRLHLALGDRPAALRAYHHCKHVLSVELGVEPAPDTVQLARSADRGVVPTAPGAAPLPLTVLRPPVLVGRDEPLARMEAAWQAGHTIYVTGDPGVGKTRFVRDFVASKGPVLYLPGYPGSRDVPFGAAAHNVRARLAHAGHPALPEWVRGQLARILPEYREDGAVPGPVDTPEERLAYFLAHYEVVKLTGAGVVGVITDDVQNYDDASIDLGAFFLAQGDAIPARRDVPRHVIVYRRGTLPARATARQEALVRAGRATVIDLQGLDETAVDTLVHDALGGTVAEVPSTLARDLHLLTGGNAQYVLETLRQLLERRDLTLDTNSRPGGVVEVIAGRFARLSERARQVLRAAGVL